jgi:hypothetical protein
MLSLLSPLFLLAVPGTVGLPLIERQADESLWENWAVSCRKTKSNEVRILRTEYVLPVTRNVLYEVLGYESTYVTPEPTNYVATGENAPRTNFEVTKLLR